MQFDTGTLFKEHDDSEVTSSIVIETSDEEGYRMAERWTPTFGEPRWVTYWLPEDDLLVRLETGQFEERGTVSDEQFEQVCQHADVRALQ